MSDERDRTGDEAAKAEGGAPQVEGGGPSAQDGAPKAESGGPSAQDEAPRKGLTRRELLRAAGAAGAAALVPSVAPASEDRAGDGERERKGRRGQEGAVRTQAPSPTAPMSNLSASETALLTAMVDRLIPSDENGPGAVESGALRYIDNLLGGVRSEDREAYHSGLAGLERYSRYSRGASFLDLEPDEQDSLLLDLQTGSATGSGAGFGGSSGSFFNMVKGDVWDAMFGDPYYGGNRGFAGWDLVGYPGARLGVSAEDQRRLEEGALEPVRRSAYDYSLFE